MAAVPDTSWTHDPDAPYTPGLTPSNPSGLLGLTTPSDSRSASVSDFSSVGSRHPLLYRGEDESEGKDTSGAGLSSLGAGLSSLEAGQSEEKLSQSELRLDLMEPGLPKVEFFCPGEGTDLEAAACYRMQECVGLKKQDPEQSGAKFSPTHLKPSPSTAEPIAPRKADPIRSSIKSDSRRPSKGKPIQSKTGSTRSGSTKETLNRGRGAEPNDPGAGPSQDYWPGMRCDSPSFQPIGDEEIDALFLKAGLGGGRRSGAGENSDGEDASSVASRGECRVGQCRLPCLQPCATIGAFTAMCCVLATLNGALTAGYVNSVITTIEKRFEIGSSYSGLIAASVEIGGVMSVVVVSYFGSTRHIPNWIGFGALITGVGTLVFTVPHMMAPAYTVTGGLNSSRHTENTCRRGSAGGSSSWGGTYPWLEDDEGVGGAAAPGGAEVECLAKESGQIGYVLTLVVAQMLIGIGGSPIYTLGTTYIDNHVSKLKAPSYIAFIYAFGVFGPVLGFALGALMLQYYVDLFAFDSVALNLTASHPRWVGAWWGGFVFIGALLVLVSVPFYGFPKLLLRALRRVVREEPARLDALISAYKKREYEEGAEGDAASIGRSIRDFPSTAVSILTNPIYIVTCLGICCEVSIVSGFVVFLPKYLETQFGSTKSMANLLTGGIAIPGAVIGILFGGYCLRQFHLSRKGAIQLTLVMNLIALASFGVFFCLGCDNVRIAGVTEAYHNESVTSGGGGADDPFHVNLTSFCNQDCSCNDNLMEPVCAGPGRVGYFSPCHAGCTQVNGRYLPSYLQNFSDCACLANMSRIWVEGGGGVWGDSGAWGGGVVRSGVCNELCDTLVPFMVMLFIMTFFISGTQMPLLMITMRSVREEEKAFALGIQFVMLRVFAYIPSPIMFGKGIDSTCALWTEQCGTQGNCLLYNLEHFRYKYVGMSFVLKSLAALFYLSIWLLLCRRDNAKGCCSLPLEPEDREDRVNAVEEERRGGAELSSVCGGGGARFPRQQVPPIAGGSNLDGSSSWPLGRDESAF